MQMKEADDLLRRPLKGASEKKRRFDRKISFKINKYLKGFVQGSVFCSHQHADEQSFVIKKNN